MSEKAAELDALRRRGNRLETDFERQQRLLEHDAAEIRELRDRSADALLPANTVAPSRISTVGDVSPADLAARREETTADLDVLRAIQRTQDRLRVPTVTLAHLPAQAMAAYFEQFGDTVVSQTASLPAAFVSTCLGSSLHAPGGVRLGAAPDDPEAEQRRLRAQLELIAATQSVAQEAIGSMARCIHATEQAGQLAVPPSETCSKDDLEDQMMIPIGEMQACNRGARCVALIELEPHEGGHRMALKRLQKRAAFAAFRNTGHVIDEGTMAQTLGQCVPCILMAYATRARAAMERDEPCSTIGFPLGVITERAGGFSRAALVASDSMPVAWPNLAAHHFVSAKYQFVYRTVHPSTGVATPRTETVYGYRFRADVLFDPSVYSAGSDRFARLPMRMPMTITTHAVEAPALPEVLISNVRAALSIEISQSRDLSTALDTLLVEFECSARMALSGGDIETSVRRAAAFNAHWHTALMQAPSGFLKNIGEWAPHTHSVLAATMWRVGLALTLQRRIELNGNTNLHAFLGAHVALQKVLFDAWMRDGTPPSDRTLFGTALAVLTPESMCAVLHQRQLYPVYPHPYMSPSMQREVRVTLEQRRRTQPLEHVRRAVLPPELTAADGREPARACARSALTWLARQHSPSVASSLPAATQWTAQAVSLIALQTDFEDAVWLLRGVLERWPWFATAAAAHTARATFGAVTDGAAEAAVNGGQWTLNSTVTKPARRAALPLDAPAWTRDLRGPARFLATYSRKTGDDEFESVPLGPALYPDTMLNLDADGAHTGAYLVYAALRIRVFELQRLAAKHDAPLQRAFERHLKARAKEAHDAAEPMQHPRRETALAIRRVLLAGGDDDDGGDSDDDSDPASTDVMDVADRLAARWPDIKVPVDDALAADLTLMANCTDAALAPLHEQMPALYPSGRRPSIGVPVDTPGRELAYHTRCALFECLELAHRMRTATDASDAHWFTEVEGVRQRHLDLYAPVGGLVMCEDTLPDLQPYVGLDMLHEADRADFGSDTQARRSWVPQVATVTRKACYIRDFGENHARNCRNAEYAAWAAQALMVSAQGTYRHACSTQHFARALELYEQLRPDNTQSREGRAALARFLVRNTYKVLVAGREFQMVTVAAAPADRLVFAAAWSNFKYVHECWVPQQAERMRRYIQTAETPEASERAVREMARAEESLAHDDGGDAHAKTDVPRVFRHLPQGWSRIMLAMFSKAEIDRQTDAVVNATGDGRSLPPIVNMIPPACKHMMVRYFSQTDPRAAIRLQWFRDSGVSPRGLAQLVFSNALYASQARPALIRDVIKSMDRVDFVFAWTALHVMVLHRDSLVLPVPWELAQRQYLAAQYRVADMVNPPPALFTHMTFCHPLGCPGAQSYHIPFADAGHYGAQETLLAVNLGCITCGRQKTDDMFNCLVRRTNESPVEQLAGSMGALIVALEHSHSAHERHALEADLERQREKLATHQSKNVRATIGVMMTRPCNEAPAQQLRIVGAMVVRRNSIPARESPRVYTACPKCAMPSVHSMDRYGPNGFSCGQCDREERWAVHGQWCISCGFVEQAAQLPVLTCEQQAAARAARTEHHIQGSSMQAHSLKAHLTRTRHDHQVKRQTMEKERVASAAAGDAVDGGEQVDLSDKLAAPMKSRLTQAEADRRAQREPKEVAPRRLNTADAYQLGRTITGVHPFPLKMRMEPFTRRVVFDDRVGGQHATLMISICRPCETRIRNPTVSLSGILQQTQAEPDEIWVHGERISLTGVRGGRGGRGGRPRLRTQKAPRKKGGAAVMLSMDESLELSNPRKRAADDAS